MTEAEYEKEKQRILRCLEKWQHNLWLSYWHIQSEFYREGLGDDERNFITLASTSSMYQYMRASIKWNVFDIKDISDERLNEVVAHELAHVLIGEMRDYKRDRNHEERVCTHLEKIFTFLLNTDYVREGESEEIMRKWDHFLMKHIREE